MKVLMLISSLDVGGAETHVLELSRGLAGLGAQVTVASGGGRFATELEREGIEHLTLPLGSKDPFRIARSYIALRSFIRREGIEIIHAHSRVAAYIAERLSAAEGIPFITTVHARFDCSPIKKYMSRWGYYVIAVSEDLGEYLRSVYGVSSERICVIPNGIDTLRFKPNEGGVGSRVLFVSRLDSDSSEGAYCLCRIAERLADRYKDLRVDIIGGGEEYYRLRAVGEDINRRAGRELVRCLGARGDVEKYMADCDLFVGVSRAALEAMSCGVPVVLAGNEGFLGEISEDNLALAEQSNFCCRGLGGIDDEKMLSAVSSILGMSAAERAERGELLRSYVLSNHGAKDMAQRTRGIYESVLREVSFESHGACICGYYGFGNLGDDTLFDQAIKRAREKYGRGIVAFTRDPRRDRYRFGVRCISRNGLLGIIAALRRSRRLILGGGTLLQDRTSLRSLCYYLSLAELARLCGAEIELWGSGIGPLDRKISGRLCARALSFCSYIGLRDKRSVDAASALGVARDKLHLEKDLAFGVSAVDIKAEEVLRRYRLEGIGRYAVFAVSGKGSRTDLDMIRQRAVSLCAGGITPVFVCMYPREDREISRLISNEVSGRYVEGIGARELISLLGSATLACGMRLHLLIFAKIAGVEFEGIGEDPKIRAFCEERGGA